MGREVLGACCGVGVTEGDTGYDRFARSGEAIVPVHWWAPARRKFVEAQPVEPSLVAPALEPSGTLSAPEAQGREQQLRDEAKRRYRLGPAQPVVERFFAWLAHPLRDTGVLPSNPFRQAAQYTLDRRVALSVLLADPRVPLDPHPLERQLRPIAVGRKNWMVCWTEGGARQVGIVQSLLASCRLQGVAPSLSLVEVWQRIDPHPAFEVHLLTPRLWKQPFATQPLRSDLARCRQ